MSTPTDGRRHTAGAYDVRFVISALIGLFGIVLLVLGLVDVTAADLDKTGGVNANLWTGAAMLGTALALGLWTWLRPVVVDPATAPNEDGPGDAAEG